ncbi:GNAT family N-acetyltransferase [Candidatus Pantoea persica]|uniref:GNAT family N-acetyltransferase n=1 Tax=Candidatus Pantoea persica TaxID=2518128 RepID=UPI002867D57A|nr:GNAT family N-acetyltransferase [Candidatus Pantoea persica]MBA2817129.1 tRNA(Met) cytidine acetyltransferase TmcA [Candidatus Pantoea persica]
MPHQAHRGGARAAQAGHRLGAVAAVEAQRDVNFLSVSFGYTKLLWTFWRDCGFQLVHIGTQREASSGCYAAMAMRALLQCRRTAGARLSPLLQSALEPQADVGQLAQRAGLSGRRALVAQLRADAATALMPLDPIHAEALRRQVE